MKKSIVASSGNVFVDLGYPPDEAAILQMRADLMADLRKYIKTKKLTQAEAANIFRRQPIAGFRFDYRQMGKIQSGDADYSCNESRHAR